ncbi:glycosyltransferase [candidate division CSSED10-310 bacterium]|uniref:Glycosyltransferase n=1 Tax=candidate division CSSED10-310 bacterium TaxID=2855610 RepID=A0ABV6YQW8_UNCC1
MRQNKDKMEKIRKQLQERQKKLDSLKNELDASTHQLKQKEYYIQYLQDSLVHKEQELAKFQNHLCGREEHIKNLTTLVEGFITSRSWQVTAPLRAAGELIRKVFLRSESKEQSVEISHENIDHQRLPSPSFSPRSKNVTEHRCKEYNNTPLISVICPISNVSSTFLRQTLDSVLEQCYPRWELLIIVQSSTDARVRHTLKTYSKKDTRIIVRERPDFGGLSASGNIAISASRGHFIVFLSQGDLLQSAALCELVTVVNENPEAALLYSDEVILNKGQNEGIPQYKPDWSPELFMSSMYTGFLVACPRELITAVGGFRINFEGAHLYDLLLRIVDEERQIVHIPKILYYRRLESSPSFEAAVDGARKGQEALQESLLRRREKGIVKENKIAQGTYIIHYPLDHEVLISIIIPTRDKSEIVDQCLTSIYEKSTYRNFEIIIVDNGSSKQVTQKIFRKWQHILQASFKVLTEDSTFNFSLLNNLGASNARGELLVLLNNDTAVITPNWLEEMAGYALREKIGAVGPVLLYPDDTVQHGGVVLGLHGAAAHSHKGFPRAHPGYLNRLAQVSNYSAVTGACMMVRQTLYRNLGGFDESLAVAFNDVDFCLKLLREGYRNVLLPHVSLYHYEAKSRGLEDTPEKQVRFLHEKEKLRSRWANLLDNDPYYNPNLTREGEDFSFAFQKSKGKLSQQ